MAVQRSLAEGRIACESALRRGTWQAVFEGADQQDGPQRWRAAIAQMMAGWALSSGACEDDTQSETADAAEHTVSLLQSKAIALEK